MIHVIHDTSNQERAAFVRSAFALPNIAHRIVPHERPEPGEKPWAAIARAHLRAMQTAADCVELMDFARGRMRRYVVIAEDDLRWTDDARSCWYRFLLCLRTAPPDCGVLLGGPSAAEFSREGNGLGFVREIIGTTGASGLTLAAYDVEHIGRIVAGHKPGIGNIDTNYITRHERLGGILRDDFKGYICYPIVCTQAPALSGRTLTYNDHTEDFARFPQYRPTKH